VAIADCFCCRRGGGFLSLRVVVDEGYSLTGVQMKIGFLMEGDEYSYARVTGFITLLYYMWGASVQIVKTGVIPDMPWGLMSVIFIPYGIGKIGEVMSANGQGKISFVDRKQTE
jgi:hypothetical protein